MALGLESYKVFFLLVCWITHDRPGLKYTVKIDGAKLHTFFFLEWGLNYCLQNTEDRSINQSHRIMTGYQSKCVGRRGLHTRSRGRDIWCQHQSMRRSWPVSELSGSKVFKSQADKWGCIIFSEKSKES